MTPKQRSRLELALSKNETLDDELEYAAVRVLLDDYDALLRAPTSEEVEKEIADLMVCSGYQHSLRAMKLLKRLSRRIAEQDADLEQCKYAGFKGGEAMEKCANDLKLAQDAGEYFSERITKLERALNASGQMVDNLCDQNKFLTDNNAKANSIVYQQKHELAEAIARAEAAERRFDPITLCQRQDVQNAVAKALQEADAEKVHIQSTALRVLRAINEVLKNEQG